ncbi:TniQ family protein [Streptomyces cyaneofuscatus]|uniref:TniQ family protein n=1 Tax=Streptomyces cyaneofuscatus TaxID=66883 RepID=UPI0036CB4285
MAPLQGEMTLSFLGRIADRYGLSVRSLLSSVTEVADRQGVAGALQGDSEVFLNAAARDRVAALCRVPQVDLRRALPAWMREEPLGLSKERPTARLHNGVETVAAWGPACPGCVAARTGRMAPARVYLAAHQRVCPRHRYWLMSLPGSKGRVIGLAGCPEVVRAQEDHRRLLCRSPVAGSAFEVAEAVTAWWWAQKWPEETLWPARLCATVPEGEEPGRWRVLAHGLVTYPETVAVAKVLVDQTMRRRIATQVRGLRGHLLCGTGPDGCAGRISRYRPEPGRVAVPAVPETVTNATPPQQPQVRRLIIIASILQAPAAFLNRSQHHSSGHPHPPRNHNCG